MLDQRHQEKEERDYLVMDLIILRHCLVNGKRKGKILVVSGLTVHHLLSIGLRKWLHMEECRFFRGERFDRRIGLFMRRSYQRSLKDKVTIIGRVNLYIRLCM